MVALKPPFRAHDLNELFELVIKGEYDEIPSCYSEDLAKVISMLL